MDIATLRQRLHSYVEGADHGKLLDLLHLMEGTEGYDETVELKERVKNYHSGKTKPNSTEGEQGPTGAGSDTGEQF